MGWFECGSSPRLQAVSPATPWCLPPSHSRSSPAGRSLQKPPLTEERPGIRRKQTSILGALQIIAWTIQDFWEHYQYIYIYFLKCAGHRIFRISVLLFFLIWHHMLSDKCTIRRYQPVKSAWPTYLLGPTAKRRNTEKSRCTTCAPSHILNQHFCVKLWTHWNEYKQQSSSQDIHRISRKCGRRKCQLMCFHPLY